MLDWTKSRFKMKNILLIVLIMVLFTTARSQSFPAFSFRQIPVGNLTTLNSWVPYILYLGGTFVSPLAVGWLLVLIMMIGFVVWALFFVCDFNQFCYLACLCSLGVVFVTVLSLTVAVLGSLIYAFVAGSQVGADGFAAVREVANIPNSIPASLRAFQISIPVIADSILNPFVDRMNDLYAPLGNFSVLVNGTREAVGASAAGFDDVSGHYDNLLRCARYLELHGFGPFDFDSFRFPNQSEVIPPATIFFLNTIEAALIDGRTQVDAAKVQLSTSLSLLATEINSTFSTVQGLIDAALAILQAGFDLASLNPATINLVETISQGVSYGVMALFGAIFVLFLMLFSLGWCFLWTDKTRYFVLACGGVSCCASFIFTIIAAALITGFFAIGDGCDQSLGVIQTAAGFIPPIQLFGNSSLDPFNFTQKIFGCGQPPANNPSGVFTYLDAVGLGIRDFGFADLVNITDLLSQVNVFELQDLLNNLTSQLNSFSNQISSGFNASTYFSQVNELDGYIENNLTAAYNQFLFLQGYDEAKETADYLEINAIVDMCAVPVGDIDRSNITLFDLTVEPWLTNCAGLAAAQATRAQDELRVYLVGNKSVIEAPDTLAVQKNMTCMRDELQLLNTSLHENLTAHVPTLVAFGPAGSNITATINNIFDAILDAANQLVEDVLTAVEAALQGNPGLQCEKFGRFFTGVQTAACTGIFWTTGGAGVLTFGLVVAFFLAFWIFLYISSVLDEKPIGDEHQAMSDLDSDELASISDVSDFTGSESDDQMQDRDFEKDDLDSDF